MELVLVVTFAGLVGTALRYTLPGRESHGLALMPAASVIIGSLGWLLAVWVGLDPRGVWSWVLALGLTLIGGLILGIMLPKRREAADAARFEELTRPA